MMRALFTVGCLIASTTFAQVETFHGWSKDGTYLSYQAPGNNDITELFFCQTDQAANPTWPASLNELDRTDERGLSCVRLIDVNKAPYQWKNALVLPAPVTQNNGIAVLSELVTDGESPGLVLEAAGKRQSCYVSGLHEDSRLQKTWWHPNGRYLAAMVDGRFLHCLLTLKGSKAMPTPKVTPPPKVTPKPGKKTK